MLAEADRTLEADLFGDLLDRKLGAFEQIAGFLQAGFDQPLRERQPGCFAEMAGEGAAAHQQTLGKRVDFVIFLQIGSDIVQQFVNVFIGCFAG